MVTKAIPAELQIPAVLIRGLLHLPKRSSCLNPELSFYRIPIFFEKEQINTMEAAGELLITILSSLAQEESRNISENVKWSLRKKYERGGLNTSRLLGYQKGDDGKLHIVPEEAEIVRYIFMKYLEGKSSCAIAKDVTAQGKKTIRGNTVWNPGVIDKILQNEKYMGDMLSQKTYTSDFLTKKTRKKRRYSPSVLC